MSVILTPFQIRSKVTHITKQDDITRPLSLHLSIFHWRQIKEEETQYSLSLLKSLSVRSPQRKGSRSVDNRNSGLTDVTRDMLMQSELWLFLILPCAVSILKVCSNKRYFLNASGLLVSSDRGHSANQEQHHSENHISLEIFFPLSLPSQGGGLT